MGRKTDINQEEVNQICKKLRSEGYQPTVDRLSAELGRGSRTTINKFLKEFLSQESQKKVQLVIPDNVQAIFHNLIGEISSGFKKKILSLESEIDNKNLDINRYMDESQKYLENMEVFERQIDDLEKRVEILNSENKALQSRNTKMSEKLERSIEAITEAKIHKKTIDALQKDIEKLNTKNHELIIENAGFKKEIELSKKNKPSKK